MNKRGQSIVEYAIIATLVILGVFFMGPYVLRSIDAHFKLWDEGAQDSFQEHLTQAPPNSIPPINAECQCTATPENCGSSQAGTTMCGPNAREVDYDCNLQGCNGSSLNSYCDTSPIAGYPDCCTNPVDEGCGNVAIPTGGIPASIPCPTSFTSGSVCVPPPTSSGCYYGYDIYSYQCGSTSTIQCVQNPSCPAPGCLGNLTGGQEACPNTQTGLNGSLQWTPVNGPGSCDTTGDPSLKCEYYNLCTLYTAKSPVPIPPPSKPAIPTGFGAACGTSPNNGWCPAGYTCNTSEQCITPNTDPTIPTGTGTTCGTGWCPTADPKCNSSNDLCSVTDVARSSGTKCSDTGATYCPSSQSIDCCLNGYTCDSTNKRCYSSPTESPITCTSWFDPSNPSSHGSSCGTSCCPPGDTCDSTNKCVPPVLNPSTCASLNGVDCGTSCCLPVLVNGVLTDQSCYNLNYTDPAKPAIFRCFAPLIVQIPSTSSGATIEVWGGGGAGGASASGSGSADGGGGGGGGYAIKNYSNFPANTALQIYPGEGGPGSGGSGSVSWVRVGTGQFDPTQDLDATGGKGGNSCDNQSCQTGGNPGSGYNGDTNEDGHEGGSMGAVPWASDTCYDAHSCPSGCGPTATNLYYCNRCDSDDDSTCYSFCAPNSCCKDGWMGNGGVAGGIWNEGSIPSPTISCSTLIVDDVGDTIQNITSCLDGIIDNHCSSNDSNCPCGIDFHYKNGKKESGDGSGSPGPIPGCGGSSGRAGNPAGNGGSGAVNICWQ